MPRLHRLAVVAAGAMLPLAAPFGGAHAATVAQVVATTSCLGGPGTATAVSAPAADGSTTGSVTLSGVPDGTWVGGSVVGTAADPTGGLTPASQTVTGGTYSTPVVSSTPWNTGILVGAYQSAATGELCEAGVGQLGSTLFASALPVTLAVHDVRNLGAAVMLTGIGKGQHVKITLAITAGHTQRRTVNLVTKKAHQTVLIKGLKETKPVTAATLVVTDLKSHAKLRISLHRSFA